MNSEISIDINTDSLDEAIEKANKLVTLLREAVQIIESFSQISELKS